MTAPFAYELEALDLEESGPLGALLDRISAEGIAPVDAPAFARWLYGTLIEQQEKLAKARADLADLQEDFRRYVDEHPDQVAPIPDATSFYHLRKEDAQAIADQLKADPRVAHAVVQFEPNNGWMVVAVPGFADLSNLAGVAEIQDGQRRPPPIGKTKPLPAPDSPVKGARPPSHGGGPSEAPAAPTKGVTAQVWGIADTCYNEKGVVDRPAIMALCKAAGINEATAGTQYSKWKKARGY